MSNVFIPKAPARHDEPGAVNGDKNIKRAFFERNEAIIALMEKQFPNADILALLRGRGWKQPQYETSLDGIAYNHKVKTGRIVPKSKRKQAQDNDYDVNEAAAEIVKIIGPIYRDAMKWRQLQNMMEN